MGGWHAVCSSPSRSIHSLKGEAMKSLRLTAAAVAVLAAACGPESSQRIAESVSCTIRVAADVDSIRSAVQQVADRTLDPCSGALTQADRDAAVLTRIDRSGEFNGYVELVFLIRFRHPG